ncbi:MAG: protein kinase domain-containing protein [Terriglobales bacterium]
MPRCSFCSHEVAEGARFCSACGQATSSVSVIPTLTSDQPPAFPPRSSNSASGVKSSPLNLSPGVVLVDRYRILGILGRGGMGMVYRADDLKLGQVVALKFLPASFTQDASRVERFRAEVRIARQVSHPNVCRVYDIGEVDGHSYLTMEYVDGEDLATLLNRIGRLPSKKALEIAHELCAGLAAAHARQVIHRDLKPANIMIDGHGHARITDFGLAVGTADSTEGEVAGTPAYMAPESFEGKPATVQSDLYSLGMVLFELYTGNRPWEASKVSDWRAKHFREQPTPPSKLTPEIDAAVERVILRCLEKDPASRPRSAIQVASALPGGNPLAAALAAGETPSPEMVAAAGDEGGISAAKAWSLLAAVAAGLVLITFLSQRSALDNLVPAEKSPEILSFDARQIASRLGYPDPPADSSYWFAVDPGYAGYSSRIPAPQRYRSLATEFPSPVQFWYRQSPQPFQTTPYSFEVSSGNPMPFYSGEWSISLDSVGRLLYFAAIGPQEDALFSSVHPLDWRPLFAAADLDLQQSRADEEQWLPDVPADKNFAWETNAHGKTLKIQGASYHNRIVFFRVMTPWARPERAQPTQANFASRFGIGLFVATVFVALAICLFFARRNLKQGRGDRQGAIRVAAAIFIIAFLSMVLSTHYVGDAVWIFGWFQISSGLALSNALEFALFYVALEPYVRRTWPEILISWSRLLAGGWKNALVGRDLLLGALFGVAIAVVNYVLIALPFWFKVASITAGGPGSQSLREPSVFLGNIASNILALMDGIGSLAALFIVAKLTRSKTAGMLFAALLVVGISVRGGNLKVELAIISLIAILWLTCLMRVGLLAICVCRFIIFTLGDGLVTSDLSRWYAWRGLTEIAVVAAIALYGFKVALAGKPIFGGAFED